MTAMLVVVFIVNMLTTPIDTLILVFEHNDMHALKCHHTSAVIRAASGGVVTWLVRQMQIFLQNFKSRQHTQESFYQYSGYRANKIH